MVGWKEYQDKMIPNAKKNSFFFIGKTETVEGKKMNQWIHQGKKIYMHAFSHMKIWKIKKYYFSFLFGSS